MVRFKLKVVSRPFLALSDFTLEVLEAGNVRNALLATIVWREVKRNPIRIFVQLEAIAQKELAL